MKKQSIFFLIGILLTSSTVFSQENSDTEGGYLLNNVSVTGGGGGFFVSYGIGQGNLNSSINTGGKGFVQLGRNFRFGGIGAGFIDKDVWVQEASSYGGLLFQYLIRLDPVIIAPALSMGVGQYHFQESTKSGVISSTYFGVYPFIDIEFRLLKHFSVGISVGYMNFLYGNKPFSISQIPVGLTFTFASF